MEDAETTQRAAEHKAAAFHNLGWENGAGATIWARAIHDELERHEAVRDSLGERFGLEAWERLHSTALLLVVAVDQVLTFERRVNKLAGGDPELSQARAEFDAVGPRAGALRDLVTHLDAYAIGEGHRQTGKRKPPIPEGYVSPLLFWGNGQGTTIKVGHDQMDLRTAATAAITLAAIVDRVRVRQGERVSAEADAALRARWRIDQ